MKKLLKFLPIVAMICVGIACVTSDNQPPDPFDVLNDSCTPTAFTLEGQQGDAVIMDDAEDENIGTITVTVENRVVDITSLGLENIRLPRGATATAVRGDRFDLLDSATLTVTSESGKTRVYSIIFQEPYRSPDKSVLSFEIDRQLPANGLAYFGISVGVEDDPNDDSKGTITLYLNTKQPNAANLELFNISVSDKASASIEVGDKLTFTNYSTTFTVTADDRSTRDYTVTYIPITIADDMSGTYLMRPRLGLAEYGEGPNAVFMTGGSNNSTSVWNLNDKSWAWEGGTPQIQLVNSYKITFAAMEETATTYRGIATLTAPNNAFFAFQSVAGSGSLDCTPRYQLIPKGISIYTRNKTTTTVSYQTSNSGAAADNTGHTGHLVSFTNLSNQSFGTAITSTCYWVQPSGTFTNNHSTSGSRVTLTVGKSGQIRTGTAYTDNTAIDPNGYAFHYPHQTGTSYTNVTNPSNAADMAYYWYNLRRVIWMVAKQPD